MYRRKYTRPVHVPAETPIDEPKQNKIRQVPAMTMTVPELAEELHISEKTAFKLVRDTTPQKQNFLAFISSDLIVIRQTGGIK